MSPGRAQERACHCWQDMGQLLLPASPIDASKRRSNGLGCAGLGQRSTGRVRWLRSVNTETQDRGPHHGGYAVAWLHRLHRNTILSRICGCTLHNGFVSTGG